MINNIKKMNDKFSGGLSNDIPIFDTLLVNEKNKETKSLLVFKKKKKINNKTRK